MGNYGADSLFELSGRALDHSSLRADVGPVTSVGVRDDSERGTRGGGGDELRVLEQAFERRVSRGESERREREHVHATEL